MKKTIQRIAALALSVVTLAGSNMVVHADEGYTYGYDYWGDVQYSPDVYKTISVYTDVELGLDKKLNAPQGLFVVGQFIYLCDTGNNRILEMERKDEDTIELVRVIDHITGDVADKEFQNPTDIAVSEEGFLYIADRDNNRIPRWNPLSQQNMTMFSWIMKVLSMHVRPMFQKKIWTAEQRIRSED